MPATPPDQPDPDDHRDDLLDMVADRLRHHPAHADVDRRARELRGRVEALLDDTGRRILGDLEGAWADLAHLHAQVALDVGLSHAAARRERVLREVTEQVAVLVADPALDRGARLDVLVAVGRTLL
jgi:hypothetical protein